MDNKKAAEILRAIKAGTAHAFLNGDAITSALDTAIDVLEKQEQSCDTCKHGYFGDPWCEDCAIRFASHWKAGENYDKS